MHALRSMQQSGHWRCAVSSMQALTSSRHALPYGGCPDCAVNAAPQALVLPDIAMELQGSKRMCFKSDTLLATRKLKVLLACAKNIHCLDHGQHGHSVAHADRVHHLCLMQCALQPCAQGTRSEPDGHFGSHAHDRCCCRDSSPPGCHDHPHRYV